MGNEREEGERARAREERERERELTASLSVCRREYSKSNGGPLRTEKQGHWNTARIPTQYKIPHFLVSRIFGDAADNYTKC